MSIFNSIESENLTEKDYYMNVEQIGDVTATTLYRKGRVVLYEETIKEIKHLKDYGDFEVTKVLRRIHFDENGRLCL
ncbi:hypothetical protein IKE67_04420 [bacterium]|nr:hypothetical protein [bacterium]